MILFLYSFVVRIRLRKDIVDGECAQTESVSKVYQSRDNSTTAVSKLDLPSNPARFLGFLDQMAPAKLPL